MKRWRSLLLLCLALVGGASFAQTTIHVPARLDATALQNDLVPVRVTGEAGCSYILETSVTFTNWAALLTNSSVSGTFVALQSPTSPSSYFRAIALLSTRPPGGEWLFDGHTYTGWNGNTTLFALNQCAIVGGNLTQTVAQNEFLCTDRSFTNFLLQLKCKLVGTGSGFVNSGIQFRSRRLTGTAVSGYQADMGEGYWGALYDESRRNIILAQPNSTAVAAILRTNDWNDYTIRAEGRRIQLWINGFQTVDYTEANLSIPTSGIIGLQVHSGGPAQASVKDILLTLLP